MVLLRQLSYAIKNQLNASIAPSKAKPGYISTTGISLLAYMDYEKRQEILIPVILASASAAGTAVYKVMFKKVMGEVNFLQVSIFFSVSSSHR